MDGDWSELGIEAPRPPGAIVPVAAAGHGHLRGARVIIGLPGHGWRGDLRADAVVAQSSRTYVPVLPEPEWYRAETDQIEVFAPLVPIERVWVETVDGTPSPGAPGDLFARLVSLDAPPRREPTPARDMPTLTGRRIVRVDAQREIRDLRAVTEPYLNNDGDVCVRVCSEGDWYRWSWTGKHPAVRETPIYQLWAE